MRMTFFAPMAALIATLVAAPALADDRKPADCLSNRSIKETRFTSEGYYARTGRHWWLNKANDCGMFRPDLSIATLSPLNRQCRGDQIRLFQNFSGVDFGTCTLGAWEPLEADAVPAPGIAKKPTT